MNPLDLIERDLLGQLVVEPKRDRRAHPLRIDIFRPRDDDLAGWRPAEASGYGGNHGAG